MCLARHERLLPGNEVCSVIFVVMVFRRRLLAAPNSAWWQCSREASPQGFGVLTWGNLFHTSPLSVVFASDLMKWIM